MKNLQAYVIGLLTINSVFASVNIKPSPSFLLLNAISKKIQKLDIIYNNIRKK